MKSVPATLRLVRFDSCLLIFLSVFLPLFARTGDPARSLRESLPLLFIGMCTFIANDLNDLESDRINHPTRPLPSNQISPQLAAALYFVFLGLALLSIKYLTSVLIAGWYYALFILVISYGYIVEHSPGVKALYVAALSSVPLAIVATLYAEESRLRLVVVAGFCLILGRELCMDLLDRDGDRRSFMHRFRPRSIAAIAFLAKGLGGLLLATQLANVLDYITFLTLGMLVSLAATFWFVMKRPRTAVRLMKLELFLGLYFLV